jgi:hypothetical protein
VPFAKLDRILQPVKYSCDLFYGSAQNKPILFCGGLELFLQQHHFQMFISRRLIPRIKDIREQRKIKMPMKISQFTVF